MLDFNASIRVALRNKWNWLAVNLSSAAECGTYLRRTFMNVEQIESSAPWKLYEPWKNQIGLENESTCVSSIKRSTICTFVCFFFFLHSLAPSSDIAEVIYVRTFYFSSESTWNYRFWLWIASQSREVWLRAGKSVIKTVMLLHFPSTGLELVCNSVLELLALLVSMGLKLSD